MSRRSASTYVVDASIAIKWYLNDEDHVSQSFAFLTAYGEGHVVLIAPDHIRYEVANSLRSAARANRVPNEEARNSLWEFLALGIPTVSGDALLLDGYSYAERFGCALYDALYLALADRLGCGFLHADRRLHNTLDGRFARAIWIEDFESL